MNAKPRVLFHWLSMGPYHFARMQAFAEYGNLELHVVESTSHDDHAWTRFDRELGYSQATLSSAPLSRQTLASVAGGLEREVERFRPDILVASGYTGGTPWRLLRRVRQAGGTVVLWSESTRLDRPRAWWRERAKSWLVRRFDGAIVAGQPQRRYIRELGLPDERIGVVGGVVDNEFFREAAQRCRREPEPARARHLLPKDYFLYVGRFIPEKNLTGLLRAYKAYRENAAAVAPWDLVLVGGGVEEESLRAYVAEQGVAGVHFAGIRQTDELAEFYALAQCFVLPSTSEPWGLVINEAMSASLPVLVSARCGCVEDLVVDGETGFVFDPFEEAALADRLQTISRGSVDLEAMGRSAFARVQDYSPRRYAERLSAFFEKIRRSENGRS